MNNHPLFYSPRKTFSRSINRLLCSFCAVILLLVATSAFSQTAKWRYVTSNANGAKSYLNDDIKVLADRTKSAREKVIAADGSAIVALEEWNCATKRNRTRQVTVFRTDQSVAGTYAGKMLWQEVLPGSLADQFYRRVCLPAPPVKWARITESDTALWSLPDNKAKILRSAQRGERFLIIPESGLGGWFNLVDPETQQDYWLFRDSFETIAPAPPDAKAAKPKGKQKAPPRTGSRIRRKQAVN